MINFKQQLKAGAPLLGTFLKTPSSMLCEVLGHTKLDVVCIDAEHSPFDRQSIDQCIFALRASGMASLVRLPSDAHEQILNALDCGATGVVIPHVKTRAQAKAVVKASHFGAGGRGFAGSTRAANYTGKAMGQHLSDSAASTVVIAQIEDPEGVDAIEEIAQVDGIDCLFVGRIDLTVAYGASSPKDPVVMDAVARICAAGRAAGRCVGMFVGDLSEIPHWRAAGASLFILGSDHGFVLQGVKALRETFDQSNPA